MTPNRPRCPSCSGETKKNGTTSKGSTRWRCKDCGVSFTRRRTDLTQARDFTAFHAYATGTAPLCDVARQAGVSRWTLNRRFEPFWLIDIPNTPDPDRVYDQIFIDGTHTDAGCLLVAASWDHVIAWHWARSETTHAYTQLLHGIAEPLCVVLDGGQGAYSAIKACWPTTLIQRCLVHAQRVIRRYTTSRPRTDAGKAIYALALKLTKITTLDQAREWTLRLHDFGVVYKGFLNEKTPVPQERRTVNHQWEYTHIRVRKAYNSLLHLSRNNWLFTYLQPPPNALEPNRWTSTTNSLEGGVNAQLKRIADAHRGRSGERQRRMLEWYLHSKTHLPDDPLEIARQCAFGQDQLAKVPDLVPEDRNKADQHTGRPAFYDNAIPTEYQHNIGIRKGPLK
ncbi:IS1249 family transposase [Corynebacterium glaucum]|uniref:IS1249 family transposase n=1 Tax=Corynebacterium glaucum TaxID=187491 RepID=UPI000BAC1C74|nr:IS1249 family transposase [Corynebacterium glaucum]